MFELRKPPALALLIALAGGAGLALAGAGPWLAIAVTALWLGSLALGGGAAGVSAPPVAADPGHDEAIRQIIDALRQPVLVIEKTTIVLVNTAALAALGAHIAAQDARVALRHPAALSLIDGEDGDTVTIAGFTGGRSVWQLTRHDLTGARWLIELTDQSAEANIGRAHTDFVANASHELRTPLAAIIGYAETLADDHAGLDTATGKRFIATIHREAQRMLALVSDLMTLSGVEAEKHEQPAERLDLSQLAARVVAEVASIAGKERVVLAASVPGIEVLGDSAQIEQVLRNLIENALRYGAPDQPVKITLERTAKGKARLLVRDRGPGIAPEHLPHLTRRFYRADPGRSRASGGTGLGLAIVKHIVERHRGELDITSTLGEGTCAAVVLPAAE